VEDNFMDSKIDYEEINRLVAFLEEKNLVEFELEVEGFKIKISRAPHSSKAAVKNDISSDAVQQESEKNPVPGPPQAQESGNSL